MTLEHDLGDGWTVIIEWAERWNAWIGTISDGKHVAGSVLRHSQQDVLDAAIQTAERKR